MKDFCAHGQGIKLYGPERGLASWSRVTKGIDQGLFEVGLLAGYCATDSLSHGLEHQLDAGYAAPRAIYVGPPSVANAMLRGFHGERYAMIAANSSWLPAEELATLVTKGVVTGFLAPSAWSRAVIDSYDLGAPALLYEHGVDACFEPIEGVEPLGTFRALHLASTANDRKGTGPLVRAWANLVNAGEIPRDSELVVVVDGPEDAISRHADNLAGVNITRIPRLDGAPYGMSRFYQEHHVVIQPSRAEGFGLVPLEARASGVPVIMTNGTGHDQHAGFSSISSYATGVFGYRLADGVLVVPTSGEEPIDDGPGALAPTFEQEELEEAIVLAYEASDMLRDGARKTAASVREYWSWRAVTTRFLDGLT